jgi:hypothetical protein
MLIENSKLSGLSGMGNSMDMSAGILPPLSPKSAKELHAFIVRSLVETGVLIVSLLITMRLLF